MSDAGKPLTTARALENWRTAEQVAAVARRGKLAAQTAVRAAEEAAEAAQATATAAKSALASATLAEQSALTTANSARVVVENATLMSVDAESESALADVDEGVARQAYRDTAEAASRRILPDSNS